MSRTENFCSGDQFSKFIDMIKSEEERNKLSEINLMVAKKQSNPVLYLLR